MTLEVFQGILCTVWMHGHTMARPPLMNVGFPPWNMPEITRASLGPQTAIPISRHMAAEGTGGYTIKAQVSTASSTGAGVSRTFPFHPACLTVPGLHDTSWLERLERLEMAGNGNPLYALQTVHSLVEVNQANIS